MTGYEIGFIILCLGICLHLIVRGFKYKPPTTTINYHD